MQVIHKITQYCYSPKENIIFIDHQALAKQGDNALGSVRPCVGLCVRQCSHSLTVDLDLK